MSSAISLGVQDTVTSRNHYTAMRIDNQHYGVYTVCIHIHTHFVLTTFGSIRGHKLEKAKKKDLIDRNRRSSTGPKERHNFTFDKELFARFKKDCEKNNVAMSPLLEDFMRDFLGEKK